MLIDEIKLVTELAKCTPTKIENFLHSGELLVEWKTANVDFVVVKNVVLKTELSTNLSTSTGQFHTDMRLVMHIDGERIMYGKLNRPEYIVQLCAIIKKLETKMLDSKKSNSQLIWDILYKM